MKDGIRNGIPVVLALGVAAVGVGGFVWHGRTVARLTELERRLAEAERKAEAIGTEIARDRSALGRLDAGLTSAREGVVREAATTRESLLAQAKAAEAQEKQAAEQLAAVRAEVNRVRDRQDGLEAFWARKGAFLPEIPPEDLKKGYAVPWKGDERLPMEAVDGAVIALPDEAGVVLRGGAFLRSAAPATNLSKALSEAGDFSVEVSLTPANLTQNGPARIVSISRDPSRRNFTIGQEGSGVHVRLRTTTTNEQGTPELKVGDILTGANQHIVFVRQGEDHILYVDSKEAGRLTVGGELSNWDLSMPLMCGNEATGDRDWNGWLYAAKFFTRALGAEEVGERFAARPRPPEPQPEPTVVPQPLPGGGGERQPATVPPAKKPAPAEVGEPALPDQ